MGERAGPGGAGVDAAQKRGRRAFAGMMRRLVERSERDAMGRATSLVLHLIRRRRTAAANGAAVYQRLVDPDQSQAARRWQVGAVLAKTCKAVLGPV